MGTFLTVKEVSKMLNVSERSIRNWIDEGILTGYKLGGTYRIKEENVIEFMEQSKVKKEEKGD